MKILHLYHDLMNLYGDYANVSAMRRMLEKSGESVTDYDFIFIGSGTERNLRVALEDFRQYKDELTACADSGKALLFTGNSFEMLGKTLTDCKGNTVDGLGMLISPLPSKTKPATPPT